MQPQPGVYNETVFEGLDFVVAEAGKRNLKLILVVADNWYPSNGIDEYVKWGGASKHQVHHDPSVLDALFSPLTYHLSRSSSRRRLCGRCTSATSPRWRAA